MNFRLLRMGLSTLFNIRKQGYFIPYRYADTLPHADTISTYPALFEIFKKHTKQFDGFLKEMASYSDDFGKFGSAPPPFPRWEQDWFPRLDGAAAYTMVRKRKPSRIIEVGSGHSTRFMMQAIKDEELDCQFTAIDPAPRADIASLPISLHNKIVQNVDTEIFSQLKSGDILFIDSSHIVMPGSDVDHLFLNILPTLPKGVLLHIHDITLPYVYPKTWDWRGYNENQITAPLLQTGYGILFSSIFASRQMKEELAQNGLLSIPKSESAFETSLWLEKKF